MRGSLCDPDRLPGDFDAAGGKPAGICNGWLFRGQPPVSLEITVHRGIS